jgi:hypothetical protein
MVNNLQCLKAEMPVDGLLRLRLHLDGEEKDYEVSFKRLTTDIIGFDFPEEVRRIFRVSKEATDGLLDICTRVAEREHVTLPATLIETPVLA